MISGIAITLSVDPELARRAVSVLAADPELTLGPRAGSRQAAVLETADSERAWERILAIPGVLHLDLACAYPLDDLDPGGPR